MFSITRKRSVATFAVVAGLLAAAAPASAQGATASAGWPGGLSQTGDLTVFIERGGWPDGNSGGEQNHVFRAGWPDGTLQNFNELLAGSIA